MTEVLACTKLTGQQVQQVRHGVRTAERTATRTASRSAERTATRTATRTGSRAGTLNGTVSYAVDYTARSRNQFTGFILKGLVGQPSFSPTGDPVWNAPQLGAYTAFGAYPFLAYPFGAYPAFGNYPFGAYPEFGATTWGDWDTDGTNAEPDVCLNNGNILEGSLVHTILEGAVVEGPVVEGPVVEGPVVEGPVVEGVIDYVDNAPGAVISTGPVTLLVDGRALPITPAV